MVGACTNGISMSAGANTNGVHYLYDGDTCVIDLEELHDAWGATVVVRTIEALAVELEEAWKHIRALEAGLSEYEAHQLRVRVEAMHDGEKAERGHED